MQIEIDAYDGGIINIEAYPIPVVVDLQGIEAEQVTPILLDHMDDVESVIGQTTLVEVNEAGISASGEAMGTGDKAIRAIQMAESGYEWQAQIGFTSLENQNIPAGRSVDVNGATFSGPVLIVRRSRLREISFVSTSAGNGTSVRLAAQLTHSFSGSRSMNSTFAKNSPQVLCAALCLSGNLSNPEKYFKEQVLDAAHENYRGHYGIQRLLLAAAARNGFQGDPSLFASGHHQILKAAFSTADIGGILSNVASKFLLEGWSGIDHAWEKVAAIANLKDFKASSSYRLTSAGVMEQIAGNGSIKHGHLAEDSYSNKLYTYGEMITITRVMQINDDMSALTRIPRMLGRKAAVTVANVFWTAWMAAQATLFPSNNANANYFEGAATNLSATSLQSAVTLFRQQTDSEGNPLMLEPKFLLVPPELEVVAQELFSSRNLNTGGASTADRVPNANFFENKFVPVVSPYLSNSAYDGYSSTAWWLMGDPEATDVAAIEVAFLNGKQEPTVESAQADFTQLGLSMRAYIDFGVATRDFRAGVKSKGKA